MKSIQTVLGPVLPDAIRICLPHEHFHVFGPNEAPLGAREEALAGIVPQLQALRRRYDCNALVECTNCASQGRDLETYAAIARAARFHVIASAGFFTYPASPWWMKDAPVRELVRRWTRDARHGMDGTGIRPGVLKGASTLELGDGRRRHHDAVRTWFEALARTHHATGLPITTHGNGLVGAAQFDILTRFGVPPAAIAIGHADHRSSAERLLPIVDKGGFVLLNFCGGFLPQYFDKDLQLIQALVDRGYAGQLLISVDVVYRLNGRCDGLSRALPDGTRPPWYREYRHVFTHAIPRMKTMGVTPAQLRQIFYRNPIRHLCGPW